MSLFAQPGVKHVNHKSVMAVGVSALHLVSRVTVETKQITDEKAPPPPTSLPAPQHTNT
jgi:hypothetical protein